MSTRTFLTTTSLTFLFIFIFASCKKKETAAVNYLNSGNEIFFDNVKYNLVWSSHPSTNYYKQEYLPEKDSLEYFKKMILLEAVTGTSGAKQLAEDKAAELNRLKQNDPIVNYDIFQKGDEIMLDFILSGKTADSDVIERSVYRYKPIKDAHGKQSVLLFGVCERAYGNDIDKFLISLKAQKQNLPNAVGSFSIPEIKIEQSSIK